MTTRHILILILCVAVLFAAASCMAESRLAPTESAPTTAPTEGATQMPTAGQAADCSTSRESVPEPTEPTPMPTDPIVGPEVQEGKPYFIKVNNLCNTVTVYTEGDDGCYTNPYRAMVCSTGSATPTEGTFTLGLKWKWLGLFGNVYGYYSTQINGNILFHSVPYTVNGDPSSLEYEEFDKLGTAASMGCIRLQVIDAKWIYEHCDEIAGVEFYSSENPGPLGKPEAPKISDNSECRGWDPTDPDEKNPWNS